MRRGLGTKLVDLMVESGVITKDDVSEAERIQKHEGGKLEHILVENSFVDADEVLSHNSLVLESVPIHLDGFAIPASVLELVPGNMATKYEFIPIAHSLDMLTVAMVNPWDIYAIDNIADYTKLSVSPVLSSLEDVQAAIKRFYSSPGELFNDYLEKFDQGETLEAIPTQAEEESQSRDSLEKLAADAPIVGLVDLILRQAIENEASDIHIEPHQGGLRVRFRIDGVLQEVNTLSKKLMSAIVSRIKIISNMDIAERRQPQDGRLRLRTPAGDVTFRVSSMPSVSGEKVVMRIANETQTTPDLAQLGMPQNVRERYTRSIEMPHGMVLVTGPTGSGKTSTLYASLNIVNSSEVNLITVEDPVENFSGEFIQIEIDPKAGRTFASILRSILRQDPDIIMVGEIRDYETAELAIQAALTGHMVFSTLHTNDAPSAIPRLLDLKVEPFLISASVSCIIAQRLVRALCRDCRKPYEPSQKLIDQLGLPPDDYTFFAEQGCPTCGDKGYNGRTGIYEAMFMNDNIKKLINLKKSVTDIQEAAVRDGMRTLRQAAMDKVVAGATSVAEALRVTSPDQPR